MQMKITERHTLLMYRPITERSILHAEENTQQKDTYCMNDRTSTARYILQAEENNARKLQGEVDGSIPVVDHGAVRTVKVGFSLHKVESHEALDEPIQFQPNEQVDTGGPTECCKHWNRRSRRQSNMLLL